MEPRQEPDEHRLGCARAANRESRPLSKLAVVSFVLSLFLWIFPFAGFASVLLNLVALWHIRLSRGRLRGTVYAVTGISVSLLGTMLTTVPQIIRMPAALKRATVEQNMSSVRVAMEDWKQAAQGLYPCSPTERTPSTNQTILDFVPRELRNPYDEDCSTREIIVFKPWPPPTPLDSILIPPGIIYVYCSKERYAIIGGAENSRPLDLILSSE